MRALAGVEHVERLHSGVEAEDGRRAACLGIFHAYEVHGLAYSPGRGPSMRASDDCRSRSTSMASRPYRLVEAAASARDGWVAGSWRVQTHAERR